MVAWSDLGIVVVTYTARMHARMLGSVGCRDVSGRRVSIRCSPVLPQPCSLSCPRMAISNSVQGVYNIYVYIYSFPEPRPTRDRPLTQVPPLCSPAKARFVDVLPLCSLVLPHCSPMLPRWSLCAPRALPLLLPAPSLFARTPTPP